MNPDIYGVIVFLHVLSAVLSIGPLTILMPVIKRLHGVEASIEQAYLSVIKVVIRIVMHAGHVLVVSGVLLLILGPYPWTTSWVILTLAVLLLSGVFLSKGIFLLLLLVIANSCFKKVRFIPASPTFPFERKNILIVS